MDDDLIPKLTHARALIFDCDGTLVDSGPVYAQAWAAGFSLSGKVMSLDWYHGRNGLSEHVLMDDFEREHGVSLDRHAVVALMRQTYLDRAAEVDLIESVVRLARDRCGQLPMAVASGGPAAIVLPTLRALGLDQLFDAIVTFDDVGKPKPEPDIFWEAARRLGTPPQDCLVFEDSDQGLKAADLAGMMAVDVRGIDTTGRELQLCRETSFRLPSVDLLRHYPQPVENTETTVRAALLRLAEVASEVESQGAYNSFLFAVGSNHGGTFYPVVLTTFPALEDILRRGRHWAKYAVTEALIDLAFSFEPEAGYDVFCGPDAEVATSLAQQVRTEVQALVPVLKLVANETGPAAIRAREFILRLIE